MEHILVIDDDPARRILLRSQLEQAGYQVGEAPEGGAGLALFRNNGYDLVITDIVMPDTDGIETILRLKQTNPQIKIIAVSNGGYLGDAQLYLKMTLTLSARRVFEKPLDGLSVVTAANDPLQDSATG